MASPSEPLTPTLAGGPLASPEPATFVIFGATGDLSQRMLLPALYRLVREREVPDTFAVVGFARRAMSHEQFHAFAREAVIAAEGEPAMPDWERFAGRLYYAAGDFGDAAGYAGLGTLLGQVERDHGTGPNRVYYLAAPPSTYEEILGLLGEHRLVAHGGRDGARNHLIIEKPFGRDQASAQRLNRIVARVIGEECVFRIDHYLGKETVQNMLVFRFANSIFEPFWNRRYVDHVQITFFEDIGIGRRGRFYEEVGVVRDVVQNHMFQLLAIVALEPPALFDAYGFRNEKAKVLRAIRPLGPEDAVRGQYGPGVMNGAKVPGYRQESDVQPGTVTPTFAAMKLYIDNWRWAGVPFYLRAGKRLARKDTEVAIVFRQPPLQLFRDYEMAHMEPNTLVLNTTQEEGISLGFAARVPGHRREIRTVPLDFRYSELGEAEHSAYEHLLLEVLRGDQTLFPRSDEVELQWAAVDPLLAYWAAQPPKDFPNYPAGSSGPAAADKLIRRNSRRWHNG